MNAKQKVVKRLVGHTMFVAAIGFFLLSWYWANPNTNSMVPLAVSFVAAVMFSLASGLLGGGKNWFALFAKGSAAVSLATFGVLLFGSGFWPEIVSYAVYALALFVPLSIAFGLASVSSSKRN